MSKKTKSLRELNKELSKVNIYKVWIHIEGLDENGDMVEGDDYHEPVSVGEFFDKANAYMLRDLLMEYADSTYFEPSKAQTLKKGRMMLSDADDLEIEGIRNIIVRLDRLEQRVENVTIERTYWCKKSVDWSKRRLAPNRGDRNLEKEI